MKSAFCPLRGRNACAVPFTWLRNAVGCSLGKIMGKALTGSIASVDTRFKMAASTIAALDSCSAETDRFLVELSAGSRYSKLAAAFPHAVHDPVASTLTLPEGVNWPGLCSRVLFIRSFYKDLWENVLHHGRTDVKKGSGGDLLDGAAIMGAEGIGKSAFGLYALCRAAIDGRTVIYNSRKGGFAVFSNGVAYTRVHGASVGSLDSMSDESALYISDGIAPDAFQGAFRLVIASPGMSYEVCRHMLESAGRETCVLPAFDDEAEMQALARAAFPGQYTEEQVHELHQKWGGNAHNVLTLGDRAQHQKHLRGALAHQPLTRIEDTLLKMELLEWASGGDDSIRHLLTMVPKGRLSSLGYKPSQPEYYHPGRAEVPLGVVQMCADEMQSSDQSKAELYRFLRGPHNCDSVKRFRGVLYERAIVVPLLSKVHGMMSLRRISPLPPPPRRTRAGASSEPSSAETSPAARKLLSFRERVPVVQYDSVEDLTSKRAASEADALFLPRYKDPQSLVDFVLRLEGEIFLVNATIGPCSGSQNGIDVRSEPLRQLLEALGLPGKGASEIPFVWVLPRHEYDALKEPTYRNDAANDAGSIDIDGEVEVAQYQMLLAIPRDPVLPY